MKKPKKVYVLRVTELTEFSTLDTGQGIMRNRKRLHLSNGETAHQFGAWIPSVERSSGLRSNQ
jgi:hypothetical protein